MAGDLMPLAAGASVPWSVMDNELGAPPFLPEGRHVLLPGRGTTFVRDVPGPPGAPVLVLLHGWTASSALNWFGCYRALGQRFRVIAIDHRGHGRGIRSRRPFRLEDCADDVAALTEVLGVSRMIPVGYSMGGPIALLTWRRHRELVDGLVLCATARRFANGRPAERAIAGGMVGLSLAASLSPESLRRMAVERFINGRLAGTDLDRWAAGELRLNDPVPLLQAGAALARFDARPWLEEIDVPSAVVMTEEDQIVAPASQLALASSLRGSKVFRVQGDHGVCATDPARFVPVLSAACAHVARQAHSASV
jgi:3-oxoadipate enol-lactonase